MIITSSTLAYPTYQPETFAVRINFVGGYAVLHVGLEELERYKRGAAMITGVYNGRIEEWDSKTPAERACYEADADWLCARIEQCKMKAMK